MPNPTIDNNFWAFNQDRVNSQLWRSLFAYRQFEPKFAVTEDTVLRKGLLLQAVSTPETGVITGLEPYPVGDPLDVPAINAAAILAEDILLTADITVPLEVRVLEFGIAREDFLYGLDIANPAVEQNLRPQDVDSLRANGIVALEVDDQTLFDNAGGGI